MITREAEQEAAYYFALALVAHIDKELERGSTHFRNKAGLLLATLDEVVHAILADDLDTLEAGTAPAHSDAVAVAIV